MVDLHTWNTAVWHIIVCLHKRNPEEQCQQVFKLLYRIFPDDGTTGGVRGVAFQEHHEIGPSFKPTKPSEHGSHSVQENTTCIIS